MYIVHRLNERILNTEKSRFLDLTKGLAKVGESMRYVTSKHHTDEVKPLTYWLLADLSQSDHRDLLSSALEQMVSALLERLIHFKEPNVLCFISLAHWLTGIQCR